MEYCCSLHSRDNEKMSQKWAALGDCGGRFTIKQGMAQDTLINQIADSTYTSSLNGMPF